MPEVRGQKWQLCAEIDVLFTPQQKPENGKRMSQVMETNLPDAAGALNAGGFQCLVESIRARR